MENNFEAFIQAYQTAPQPIKDVIDSEEIGTFVSTLLTTHKIDTQHQRALIVAVSNRLLSITSDSDVTIVLQSLPIEKVEIAKIAALISAFVLSKIGHLVEKPTQSEVVSLVHQTSPRNTLEADITETEEAIQSISGLRTMAKDMEQIKSVPEEVVYTNTQEALLREGKKINSQN